MLRHLGGFHQLRTPVNCLDLEGARGCGGEGTPSALTSRPHQGRRVVQTRREEVSISKEPHGPKDVNPRRQHPGTAGRTPPSSGRPASRVPTAVLSGPPVLLSAAEEGCRSPSVSRHQPGAVTHVLQHSCRWRAGASQEEVFVRACVTVLDFQWRDQADRPG